MSLMFGLSFGSCNKVAEFTAATSSNRFMEKYCNILAGSKCFKVGFAGLGRPRTDYQLQYKVLNGKWADIPSGQYISGYGRIWNIRRYSQMDHE